MQPTEVVETLGSQIGCLNFCCGSDRCVVLYK